MNYKPKYFKLPEDGVLKRTRQKPKVTPYVFNDEIAIAVDIALATNRPLLVAGLPGSGKSRLAEAIAEIQEWNYLYHTMTSRTQLEQLTVEVDHLQRLHDAQEGKGIKPDWAYYKPGVFWWAFDKKTAITPGKTGKSFKSTPNKFPGIEKGDTKHSNTVLLIDEIDKAEPDLPNDLLEPLDQLSFQKPNGESVFCKNTNILTIITTNKERKLPPAFLRRCVSLEIEAPDEEKLKMIASYHFPKAGKLLIGSIAKRTIELGENAKKTHERAPSTSEFLNAIEACINLKIKKGDPIWDNIESALLNKSI